MTTLIFNKGQTAEGFQWDLYDKKTHRPLNLTGATATFVAKDRNGTTVFSGTATILSPASDGVCQYLPTESDMNNVGTFSITMTVVFGDGTIGVLKGMKIIIID